MPDLIDRAALLHRLCAERDEVQIEHACDVGYHNGLNMAASMTINAPAVDAVGCSKVEPCEYCDGQGKRLFAVEGDGSTYATHAGIWFNSGKAYLGDSDGCDFLIKYCPMCGRRLEG